MKGKKRKGETELEEGLNREKQRRLENTGVLNQNQQEGNREGRRERPAEERKGLEEREWLMRKRKRNQK